MTLWDELTRPEILAREIREWDGSSFASSTYGEVVGAAMRVAAGLRKRGSVPGAL